MRVHRETFLFLAGALWACHAEHRRAADKVETKPLGAEVEPAPLAPAPALTTDAGAPSATDAGVGDAPSTADVVDAADAGVSVPPPSPPPPLAQLRKRCVALSKPEPGCPPTDTRAHMCRTALTEFIPAAAARAVECLASIESSCDVCGVRTCVKNALDGLPTRQIAECAAVAKSAEQASEGYGETMRELCESYASGMTAQGRARFTQCLKKYMGAGVRICLWDPSTTPCTENFGSPPSIE